MQRTFFVAAIFCVSLFAVGFSRTAVVAQEKTVWSGIFTAEQSARGKEKAVAECGQCHGEKMEGALAPTLTGNDFIGHWYDSKLRELSDKITMTMPAQAPGTLKPEEYADILAYLLEVNGFPAGTETLTVEPAASLDAIKITKSK